MDKRLSKFEHGYLCAISNTISGHGADTSEWDTFKALGLPLREVLQSKQLNNFDIENLSKLKSFDTSYDYEDTEQ